MLKYPEEAEHCAESLRLEVTSHLSWVSLQARPAQSPSSSFSLRPHCQLQSAAVMWTPDLLHSIQQSNWTYLKRNVMSFIFTSPLVIKIGVYLNLDCSKDLLVLFVHKISSLWFARIEDMGLSVEVTLYQDAFTHFDKEKGTLKHFRLKYFKSEHNFDVRHFLQMLWRLKLQTNTGSIPTRLLGPLLRFVGENPSDAEVQVK